MVSVSGSISLDMTKVSRDAAKLVVAELTRRVSSDDEPLPLEIISAQIANVVADALMPTLLGLHQKVDALTELVRAEADRRDRVQSPVETHQPEHRTGVPNHVLYDYQLPTPEQLER